MGWAKFDDQFSEHPKVVAAGPWAELLAMRAVIHCARFETDGHVRATQLRRLSVGIPSVARQVNALVTQGLWEEDPEGDGWWVHDFLEYHPSRIQREAVREEARERMRRVRANNERTSRNPDPTRPEPHTSSHQDGLREFNQQRATDEAKKEAKSGAVRNIDALATWKSRQPAFKKESEHLWAHRDCKSCKGKGTVEGYAPGAGTTHSPCPGGDT